MFTTLLVGAVLGLARPDPCAKPVPRGPAVPAPLILSTDCGWFRLDTDGDLSRLPADWYARHKRPWHPTYGLMYRRTRPGRYIVMRNGRVVWRSTGFYYNEDGSGAFGPHAFAFSSWRRSGVLLTDLRRPERLVARGRDEYPIGFAGGELLVAGRRTITVVSADGTTVRRLRYRRSSSFSFDEPTGTVYFVSPAGMLTATHGSAVHRIRKIDEAGWIGVLGRRLLTVTARGRLTVLRRDDGSVVASAAWIPSRGGLDAGVSVSDDGRRFAFRVSTGRGQAVVYVLRAGEHRAHAVYRHPFKQAGCGYSASLAWAGSALLYRSDDGSGVAEAAVLAAGRSVRLTPLLRALPRKSAAAPGNVFWPKDFLG